MTSILEICADIRAGFGLKIKAVQPITLAF